jgi:GTPase SAR1 family protein
MSSNVSKQKSLKCVLFGPSGSGKTAFATQLVKKTFDPQYASSIGAAFLKYKHTDEHSVELWDTAGHQRYMALSPMYLRGANIILLFVNPTSNGTNDWRVDFGHLFNAISSQISPLYNDCESKDIPRFAFVCTHSDQSYVNIDHLEDFQTELTKIVKHNVPIFHVSSLNGQRFGDVTDYLFGSPSFSPDSHIMDSHIEVDNEEKEDKNEGKFCTIM